MTTSQPNLLQLAKQGDPKAIESLINRQLQFKGIVAKVLLHEGLLQVFLEAEQVPEQQTLSIFVHKGVVGLQTNLVRKLRIEGRQRGNKQPCWVQEFELIKEETPLKQSVYLQSSPLNSENSIPQNRVEQRNNASLISSQGVKPKSTAIVNQNSTEYFDHALEGFKNTSREYGAFLLLILIFFSVVLGSWNGFLSLLCLTTAGAVGVFYYPVGRRKWNAFQERKRQEQQIQVDEFEIEDHTGTPEQTNLGSSMNINSQHSQSFIRASNGSRKERLYFDFVNTLKSLQMLGYIAILLIGVPTAFMTGNSVGQPGGFVLTLICLVPIACFCFINYLATAIP